MMFQQANNSTLSTLFLALLEHLLAICLLPFSCGLRCPLPRTHKALCEGQAKGAVSFITDHSFSPPPPDSNKQLAYLFFSNGWLRKAQAKRGLNN